MIKAKLLKVADNEVSSFDIRYERAAYFDNPWHYHPEFELTLVTKSSGIRFVGDSVEQFEEGDLVLLGSNLPHYWRNNEQHYSKASSEYAEAYILRFRSDHILRMIHEIPETTAISNLLKKSSRGIWFDKASAKNIEPLMVKILQSQGMEKLICFLEVMRQLSISSNHKILSAKSFTPSTSEDSADRMNIVLNYINKNMSKEITLADIASVASMNPTAFCRYFRSQTNKTFIELLNDIRISNARRLILDTKRNISEISHECGFKNTTHFNYTFKKITHQSPSAYRRKWMD